ncbi:uncharacterized protein LOC126836377 isoform X2 [Adelges cooleyi]|uniref:uncharacterized protein LOC126836377 isoform X2 n=1 Tax=Adelges cooleyi TaxID=133065 RepID=UPI00217F9D71|nr:uncharacterized protein LOC126836377 isoform X2 [Adelges cooleyi]
MKHFCVLMTLVLGYVLALDEDSFKQHVNRTITFYVMDSMDIKTLATFLAAPTPVFKDGYGYYLDDLRAYEEHLQRSMSNYVKQPGALKINMEQVTLLDMGKDRRNIIKGSLLRLLKAVEGTIQTAAFNVHQRCRLVALLVNVEQPDKHICYSRAAVTMANENNCRLKYDKSDGRVIVYRMWNDGYYYQVLGSRKKGPKLTPKLEQQSRPCTIL